ncbi:MAG TPA: hypothetical protein PK747_00970 [Acidobacteriota bacterium]|nr:hypothetical protein [Acidobacteriota bacterium]HQO19507.1 hypothetical protein [Acidobacteriota bacterium]HQQ45964.1 hypothetical protein [Acidobacteriota bacterium]
MITTVSKEKLVEVGSRFRAMYLVEQAGYTLGIAAKDGQALYDLLPEGFPKGMDGIVGEVKAAMQDKELMKEEAKDATRQQNRAAERAKVWRRKVVRRSTRAMRLGETIPDGLLSVGRTRKIPELQGQIEVMIKLFEENISKMPGKGADQLLAEGREILEIFRSSDATQEVKRLKSLPDSVQLFYEKKGLLYMGLKAVNDAGHELWADDSESASRYNLSILHRNAGKRKEEAKPVEEPKK